MRLRSFTTGCAFCALGAMLLLLGAPGMAVADSIDPDSFIATLIEGESVTITKTVTADTAPPTGARVDVFFLFETGYYMMGPPWSGVEQLFDAAEAGARDILTNASALGDVAFGVGHYEDFRGYPYGGPGDTPYFLVSDLTTDHGATQAAIDWVRRNPGESGGSELYALSEVSSTTSWRADSARFVVWFAGNAVHDGDLDPGYPSDVGLGDAIAALNAKDIVVEVAYMDWPPFFLPTPQATAIADATGGHLYDGLDVDSIVDSIVGVIDDAIFTQYGVVELQVLGADPGVDVSIAPSDYTGDYDRSVVRTFEFDMTVTGLELGEYDFEVCALLDGGCVAVETDHITVDPAPEPSQELLFAASLVALGVVATWKRR